MSPQILFLIIGLAGVGLTLVGIGKQRRPAINIDDRLATFGDRPKSLDEVDLEKPFSERVIKPMIKGWSNKLGERSPARSTEKIRIKLQQAGNPSGMGATEFTGLRFLVAIGLAVGSFLLFALAMGNFSLGIMIGPALGVFGFLLPGIWLDRQIKARKKVITKALPDAIDMLTISVESGLGFDPALMRVAEKWDNALTLEFARVLSEMRIGKSKREALREMAQRVDEDSLTTFISSVIQADQLGVAITHVLRIQSEAMRVRRRQRAEEMAQKAPLKMLFPMAFLIFPSLYVIILGPAIPDLIKSFS